jgi:type I restriction enzyme R subunit
MISGMSRASARDIIDQRQLADLATVPFSQRGTSAVPERFRSLVLEYIKDYVSLSQFAA